MSACTPWCGFERASDEEDRRGERFQGCQAYPLTKKIPGEASSLQLIARASAQLVLSYMRFKGGGEIKTNVHTQDPANYPLATNIARFAFPYQLKDTILRKGSALI